MKVIGVHMDRCTGCKTCELYCGAERGSEGKTLLAAVQGNPVPPTPHPRRGRNGGRLSAPVPPLPPGALSGRLSHRRAPSGGDERHGDPSRGSLHRLLDLHRLLPLRRHLPLPERKIAVKCDRCLYMEKPVCVDVCPTRALELVELDGIEELLREKRQKTTKAMAEAEAGNEGIRLLDLGR